LGAGAAVLALCAGCGAGRHLKAAQNEFEKARSAGAADKATYEFHAAESYLMLAEHERHEWDVVQAKAYAGKSLDFSKQAVEKAGGGAQ